LWSAVIALIAIALLLAGGLSALQTAAIATALPFSLALLAAIWGMGKALRLDADKRVAQVHMPHISDTGRWRHRLANLLEYPGDADVTRFQQAVVLPALSSFSQELGDHGVASRVVNAIDESGAVRLEVFHGDSMDFCYEVVNRVHPRIEEGPATEPLDALAEQEKFHRAEVHLSEGGQDYDVMGWSRDQIAMDVLSQYEQHLQFLHSLR
jgi:choline/glycine/proline betaine transport protein